jgi:regulator of sigma E protease
MAYVFQNLPFFLVLIGPLIFFHELGHFLVAKACGVRVMRFSLGFGPKLVAFQRGETEYMIAAIPLGGYVKMWGDDPSIPLEPSEQHGSFLHQPLWKRAAIVIAGPAFNIILAALVYAGMFKAGLPDNTTKLGLVIAGSPAAQAGLVPGDEVVAVDGHPVAFWSELQKRIQDNGGTPMRLDVKNGETTRQVSVTPNLQDEQDELRQTVKRGKIGISVFAVAPLIDVADPESPAALAGLKTGDEITRVGDVSVATWFDTTRALAAETSPEVTVVVKRKEGTNEESLRAVLTRRPQEGVRADAHLRPDPAGLYSGITSYDARVMKVEPGTPAAKMGIRAGDRLVAIEGKPITAWRFDLASWNGIDASKELHVTYARGSEILTGHLRYAEREVEDEMHGPAQKAYVFGAENDPQSLRSTPVTHDYGFVTSVVNGLERTYETSRLTVLGTAYMLTGKLSRKEVGSVIMLFVVAEKAAARGIGTFLDVMAMVSVSLGVMNLLPVPVLDGGHLVFIGAEAIRRKPLSIRAREYAALAGFALLLLLMAFAFFNDINKFILR